MEKEERNEMRMRIVQLSFAGLTKAQHRTLAALIDNDGARFEIGTHEEGEYVHTDPKLVIPVNHEWVRGLLIDMGLEDRGDKRLPYRSTFYLEDVKTILAHVGDLLEDSPVALMRDAIELKEMKPEGWVGRLLRIREEISSFYDETARNPGK